MVVVGFAAHEGTYTAMKGGRLQSDNVLQPGPAGSLESFAHAAEVPRFLLDLRGARQDAQVTMLLRSGVSMRSIGSMAMEKQFHPMPILDHYDVLAWVNRTEATRPLGR